MRRRWTTLLPPEHGSWAFLILPATVGMLRRPSWAGGMLAAAALCALLLRTPLQRRSGIRRHPQAEGWIRLLGPLGGMSAIGAMVAGSPHLLVILGIGAALLVGISVPAAWAARRSAAWELGAAALFTLQAPAMLRFGGASLREAALVWTYLALFTLPPVLYLRQRLDRNGGPGRVRASLAVHAAALVAAFLAFHPGSVPVAFLVWPGLLALRAAWGAFQPWRPGQGTRLGITEAALSGVHLTLLAAWGGL